MTEHPPIDPRPLVELLHRERDHHDDPHRGPVILTAPEWEALARHLLTLTPHTS